MSSPNFPKDLDIQPSSSSFAQRFNDLYDHVSQKQAIQKYGIAGRVWWELVSIDTSRSLSLKHREAAYLLNCYLDPPSGLLFDPPFLNQRDLRILELGSGSGMVGINLARSLKPQRDILILTDLPEVCPLLENNVEQAQLSQELIYVRPLVWGNSNHAHTLLDSPLSYPIKPLTHILCSDLVYFPDLLAPLLRSLIQLSSPPFVGPELDLQIIMSYKIRSLSKETPFWSAFSLWFTFEPVLACESSTNVVSSSSCSWQRFGSSLEGPIFIFIARRRPESLTWTIPSSDGELLAGFGAQNTMQPKSDETFETLLFMTLSPDTEP